MNAPPKAAPLSENGPIVCYIRERHRSPVWKDATLKIAVAALFIASLAAPAFAQDAADLVPPQDFDEATWQAEFDAADTDGDGYISPEEDKAALFKWHRERAEAAE